VLDLIIYHSLCVSKKHIFYKHIWVCCGCDVIVTYDIIDRQIETIHSVSESYTVMHSRQYKSAISDIETDDSDWRFGHYCVQSDLVV